jgi:hypothetical protein
METEAIMKINRVEFLQATKFLIPAIGQNDSRKNLMCVHVVMENDWLQITTANAFIVKRVTFHIKSKNKCSFLIWGEDFCNISSICQMHRGKKKDAPYGFVQLTKRRFESNEISFKINEPQVDFPNLDRLFIRDGTPDNCIGLNQVFLGDIITGWTNWKNPLIIRNNGKEGPVLIEKKEYPESLTKYEAVIMPVRITSDNL